jgi:glyoxylase-like metal-dependent hydrolase (beta-lactamase superfamily II)
VQVSEGIHRLTQGVTNFYLIGESGKYTVIDAGTPGDWAFFARSLAGLGAKLADVDAVLLTHAHPDHTGFAERARTEAGAQVWIHRADEQAARTGQTGKRDGRITSYLLRAAFYRQLAPIANAWWSLLGGDGDGRNRQRVLFLVRTGAGSQHGAPVGTAAGCDRHKGALVVEEFVQLVPVTLQSFAAKRSTS